MVQAIQFDGSEKGKPYPVNGRVELSPLSLATLKVSDYNFTDRQKPAPGLSYSNIPYNEEEDAWYFQAPMESYRFIKHHAQFRDPQNNVFMMGNPYDEIEVGFK